MTYVKLCRALQWVVVSAVLTAVAPAHADDHHYQNYLVGERAVGLGGAFSAIANDSSGVFYNPAGLTTVAYSSINLQAAIYGFASNSTDLRSSDIQGGGEPQQSQTFITYPTTAVWRLHDDVSMPVYELHCLENHLVERQWK